MEEIMKHREEMKSNTSAKAKHQKVRNTAQEKAKQLISIKQQKEEIRKLESLLPIQFRHYIQKFLI